MRKCTKCGRLLDESNFNRVSSKGPELRCWCKDCVREYQKAYIAKKKLSESERTISLAITNNKIDDIFSVTNLKDIPLKIRRTLKIPKKLLSANDKPDSFKMKSNIDKVLRRTQGVVHCSQIQVAYYRMHGEMIKMRQLTILLNNMKKNNKRIENPHKGYYSYRREE